MSDASVLAGRLCGRATGLCLYGFAPPRLATAEHELREIAAHQAERIRLLGADGVIVYDIQDESDRTAVPRPFPFLPTVDPTDYALEQLKTLEVAKIVYRSVSRDSTESFARWLTRISHRQQAMLAVLVGAPSRRSQPALTLSEAYALRAQHAPSLIVGGVAISERHARSVNEHQRMLDKTQNGCRFFITQAVYDVTSAKSLLSDYAIAAQRLGQPPLPVIFTFSPCGSVKTLAFMQWLGISFPRWLENELRFSSDPLGKSVTLCERIFAELWEYANDKALPIGVNVESVSVRKVEIEASLELFRRLRSRIGASAPL
ncbi:MAG TPA: hypothetical protein VNZ06_01555 [Steroidobacteraceae bacterium]|jgi:5,10-methylenetetrahydrofolate reductase|nr:hypothetical protein [Steroidobacteraceae bacterium]